MITATLETTVFEAELIGGAFEVTLETAVFEVTLGSMAGNVTIIEGGGGQVVLPAGGPISALRAVSVNADGKLIYADRADIDTMNVVGVSLTSASAEDQDVTVVNSGEMEDAVWNWTPGGIFVGGNGLLTQTAAVGLYSHKIGMAVSPTRIVVDQKMTLEL